MKYIQSFYNYAVTFSSIAKGIPAKNADGELRNIVAVSEEELETLQNSEPLFRQLLNQKKYRVLNKLPESYKPSSVLVNEAREEATSLKSQNEELKQKLAEMEAKLNGSSENATESTAEEKTETSETAENSESEEKTESKKSKLSKK